MKPKGKSVADFIFEKAEPTVESLGLILWDVRFEKEGANYYLRLYIDKPEGIVTIQDCENVTVPVNKMLDELDPVEGEYIFEVSSTGLGRSLRSERHFNACLGKEIRVGFFKADENGKKEAEGLLEDYSDGIIKMKSNEKILTLKTSECSYIKLNDDKDIF